MPGGLVPPPSARTRRSGNLKSGNAQNIQDLFMEMNVSKEAKKGWAAIAVIWLLALHCAVPPVSAQESQERDTKTPIKHVIILIGENRTFDNIYATYEPRHDEVANLLSKGI